MPDTATPTDTLERIKLILRKDLKLGPDAHIPDEMPLMGGDVDLDSLDILLLLTTIEKQFGVKVPSEAIGKDAFRNVGTLATFIDQQLSKRGPAAPTPASTGPIDHLKNLPHGEPFRFVNGITYLKPGDEGEGYWDIRGNEFFFAGHFPGNPIVPGVLISEALAQFSGLVGTPANQTGSRNDGKLAHVDIRFDEAVTPPAKIVLRSKLTRTIGPLQQFDVTASVNGNSVARGSVTLSRAIAVTTADFLPKG